MTYKKRHGFHGLGKLRICVKSEESVAIFIVGEVLPLFNRKSRCL